MAVLDDLGTYLQTQGLGTLGTTLFRGGIPLDVPEVVMQDALVALVETPGLPPNYVHSTLGPDWEQPVVQTLVRGGPYGYAAARTVAQNVFLALGRIANQSLSGTWYLWVLPLQSPFLLRTDESARPILACQFRCAKSI